MRNSIGGLFVAWATAAAAEPEWRAGAAQVVITPPAGAPLAGYYHARNAEGTLDDLYAKALVLQDGTNTVAWVTLDLITTTFSLTREARSEIERRTGIPGSNVLISATHAHTGPELTDRGRRGALFSDTTTATNAVTTAYSDHLPTLIAEAVARAQAQQSPVHLSAATGRCDQLAFNRRFYLQDGSVAWNPGKLNPNVMLPAGPTDPKVGLLLIEPPHPPAQLVPAVAAFVNFAMHPDTVGGTQFSADFPGALSRRLADYHGTNCVTLFANGTCGNLNHLDVNWVRQQSTRAEAERLGTILAASVFLAEKSLRPVPRARLQVRSTTVALPLAPIAPEEVTEARLTVRTGNDRTRENFLKLVKAYQVLDVAAREGRPLEVEVQVIALGNELAWVSLPGEIFVELGLALKRRSPFRQTFLAELANGSIGYIPDRRSYAEGNYEPISARCAAGSGEQLVEVAVKLLEELAVRPANAAP
ncbi:MAG: neutral/alkaline non-lysosomal ceramidase N-terminal domain-containing protein [Verrucomicrobia bacterium]|nr:neutral/alkaline non-lysosomal ceramidase N-terminal domain-containing protein [Verrucomicrobiota bacterium]